MAEKPDKRIMSLIKIDNISGCWNWQGSKLSRGYGRLCVGSRSDGSRKTILAHRYSYSTFIGDIPDGMEVCHKCDNPSCVNPEHLFIGTRQDNVNDREVKNRNHHVVGERCGCSKLTAPDVVNIRADLSSGYSLRGTARKYGLAHKTVSKIRDGKAWKHLLPAPPDENNHAEGN